MPIRTYCARLPGRETCDLLTFVTKTPQGAAIDKATSKGCDYR